MNWRQKKKQFKKIHGHNPPKGWDGKNRFVIGVDGASEKDWREAAVAHVQQGNVEKVDAETLLRTAETAKEAWKQFGRAISKAAEVCSKAFSDLAKMFNAKPEQEDPCVVLARNLTERRKKRCMKKRKW